jgi:hypothetical protein
MTPLRVEPKSLFFAGFRIAKGRGDPSPWMLPAMRSGLAFLSVAPVLGSVAIFQLSCDRARFLPALVVSIVGQPDGAASSSLVRGCPGEGCLPFRWAARSSGPMYSLPLSAQYCARNASASEDVKNIVTAHSSAKLRVAGGVRHALYGDESWRGGEGRSDPNSLE